ncbi:Protoheme IX farnesyltransferase, mitochondrial [Pichia californica]|nr:Protoheme IX farnesyltransferase, mitochondrial [[Candida] californica]
MLFQIYSSKSPLLSVIKGQVSLYSSTSGSYLQSSTLNSCDFKSLHYSNNIINNITLNFIGSNVNSINSSLNSKKPSLRFTPNYRITIPNLINNVSTSRSIYSTHTNSSTITADSNVSLHNKRSPLDAVAGICHPSNSNTISSSSIDKTTITDSAKSHIPFEVKTKNSKRDERSVLEQYFQGENKTIKQLFDPYLILTKPHLTFLIMLSSICSYTLAPNAVDMTCFIFLTIGTLLSSGAANAINMGREPNFDSQMVRTSTRPVVTGLIKPNEAFTFAAITGTLGCTILYYGVNPTVAALGATNIVLYSWLYTSLKRKSILNTWVGAIVGAIPPLMGWAACSSLSDPGAWCLALLLYAWQFPHFNSLSHNIKDEYKRAGYVMTAFVNPKLNARVALRYSIAMFPICFAMIYFGVCDPYFAIDSSVLNAWMTYNSFKFWLQQRHNYSKKVLESGGATKSDIAAANIWAKKTFWSSIWQLPVVLALAMLHKQGQWDRFFGNSEEKALES